MARADVLQLVDNFGLDVADTTETAIIYDELVRELGFAELLTSTETVLIEGGETTAEFSPETIRILELHSDQLGRLDKTNDNALRAIFGNSWRYLIGTTLAYTQDQQSEGQIRLVPAPSSPLTLTAIRTDTRIDVPVWMELPMALAILGREFTRESDHQDIQYATACSTLSSMLFAILGIIVGGKVQKEVTRG